MCGIAGIIYADANGGREVGSDMTLMLQSMKHRGPDSTGYALFGPRSGSYVMRFTLADTNDPRDFEFADRIRRNRFLVEQRLRRFGAQIHEVEEETEYAYRVTFDYVGELKQLADLAEKMSEGASLEDAMRDSLHELDGVFTYMAVTEDALGVAKDEMAAKPLVLYEGDDMVALASEEIAIRAVLDREIDTYDPFEGEVMVWHR